VTAKSVVVLDYGSGNLRSAQRALQRVGADVEVTADLEKAADADGLVVPGVGAFEACMTGLRGINGQRVIAERVAAGRPVLGVCVGMQILFARGVEFGVESTGCGQWAGAVTRLDAPVIPHMGWNVVTAAPGSALFKGLDAKGCDVSLILLPAVDVVDGKAVRLVQGKAGSETDYGSALDAALAWQRDGAEWVHLVDLDAAFGRGSNREMLAEVVGKLDVKVELSGGIRDDDSLGAALATGCARVNLGTAALENPQWCAKAIAEHGDRVAVGLDVQIVEGDHRLRGRGWETDGGDLWQVLDRLDSEGCSRFVVTDVTKDGTLTGPNLDLLRAVANRTDVPVIASGGVSSLDDLRAIATLTGSGVEGAIVGKALYAGRFTLPEALSAVAG
jgi:1-(5-phosphoribosyl)-5-[(5-phosphoribosylamino)methylideneamino] imidazole-4-carboxamide isomerase/N-(5'phosphoribosyl)anthranilate isomerase/imidazole glycerol phosphate synthase glutamine amidotransferase subunit